MQVFDLPLSTIRVTRSARKEFGDIDALAQSMAVCLLHPIVVNGDNELIAGERRLLAAKKLKWDKIACHVAHDLNDAMLAVQAQRDENTCRKDFTPSEFVAVTDRAAAAYRPKATEAHKEGVKKGGETAGKGRPKDSSGENFPRAKRDRP